MRNAAGAASARPRVAVVGAGVIGLSIGWRLAAAGCETHLFERDQPGRSASWAAGGMLMAGVEIEPGEEWLWPLTRRSQELWPGFVQELEAAAGQPVGYRGEGTLVTALGRDDVEALRFHHDLQTRVGARLHWLSGAEVREREPFLAAGTVAGVFSPDDHQVDNRWLVEALITAFRRAGGHLHSQSPVTEIRIEGGPASGRARGVVAQDRFQPADMVVVAAGAWSRDLPGLPAAVRPPVRPIRGQLLYLEMPADAPLLQHVVWPPRAYLIPRQDGRLLVGATSEERGFTAAMTAGGVYSLLDGAWRGLPGIEELTLRELVVGFRPGSRDDAPILGPTSVDGLVMATGHHRNGILLTPVTAEIISRFILTGNCDPVAQPFTLARFARPPVAGTTP